VKKNPTGDAPGGTKKKKMAPEWFQKNGDLPDRCKPAPYPRQKGNEILGGGEEKRKLRTNAQREEAREKS